MPSTTLAAPPSASEIGAFRTLERALERRQRRALDGRLALEIAAIALLLAAVLFWQVRVPLDGWAHHHGKLAAAGMAAALFTLVAALCAWLTCARLRGALAGASERPEWLALPCEPVLIRRHLEWRARGALPFFLVAQLAIWISLLGLIPLWAMLALGIAAATLTVLAARGGGALGMRLEPQLHAPGGEVFALPAALAHAPRTVAQRRHRAPRWRARAPWFAIVEQDLSLTRRATMPRTRAALAVILLIAAALTWLAGWPPAISRAVAFGLALLAAAVAAEWLIDVTSLHPFSVVRTLPVGVGAFWGARVTAAIAITALVTASQLGALRLMEPFPLRVHLVWTGAAALAISVFGANLAVTLYPRGDHARRVLSLSLALAAVASFILPLSGWVLLLTALLHSARRLPPWTRGELLSCS